MKLVFIYGPPGVGKFTVGKQLAKITGYKLFPNHFIRDPIQSIFERWSRICSFLIYKFRFELIQAAAREGIKGLITTCAYRKPEDNNFVRKVIKGVRKYKGKVFFIRLYCDKKELFRRIKNPSRRKFIKTKTLKDLKILMKKFDLFSSIPYVKSLIIDNTKLSPKKVAEEIKNYYKLE